MPNLATQAVSDRQEDFNVVNSSLTHHVLGEPATVKEEITILSPVWAVQREKGSLW